MSVKESTLTRSYFEDATYHHVHKWHYVFIVIAEFTRMKLYYHPQIHSFEIGCPRGRIEDLQGGKMKYSYHTGSQS